MSDECCGNEELILIRPACAEKRKEKRLTAVLSHALAGVDHRVIRGLESAGESLAGRRLLFAIEQGESGINLEYYRLLKELRVRTDMLHNAVGGIIVDGSSELFTKSLARDFVFTANRAGCRFPGRPLTEGTATLHNFNIQAKNLDTDAFGAYRASARTLVKQIMSFSASKKKRPKLLVLHASNTKTSNTSTLWNMVKQELIGFDISEISLLNGTIQDCAGCPYTACLHFGERERCYYGGVIVEQIYPAVKECDGLLMLCPNYNDALSANLSAFINRLTALFRKMQFYDKYLFGIVVSGYSGGDIVAGQLISALNMNKTFILPSRFCMMETANDPGSILKAPGIENRAAEFAANITRTMKELE